MSTVEKSPIELQPAPRPKQHLYVLPPASPAAGQVAKRALDFAGALAGLVVLAPLLAGVALTIRLVDGGPALFRQSRIGLHGRPFTMLKFRTMVRGAEQMRGALEPMNKCDGPIFKLEDDPRVTRLGRFLRVTSIDELPQLLNVLRGEMSLVGPRPALPAEVDRFDPRFLVRHHVRPGITGLWQAYARDDHRFSTYEQLDLQYVFRRSLVLDFKILVRTFLSVPARGVRMMASQREPLAPAPMPLGAVTD